MTLSDIKQTLRAGPYAWPGGYPQFFVTFDGAALSFDAVREQWREVVGAALRKDSGCGWRIYAVDVNWENPDLFCDHSGARIPSAYTED